LRINLGHVVSYLRINIVMTPTKEQQAILDSRGNLVIIANPGSGKTYVISEKIKQVLPELLEYQGVVAISYTNKASLELRTRCLSNGIPPKASFFGTMDKFYLSEIIIPFGKQLFGIPESEIVIIRVSDLEPGQAQELLGETGAAFDPLNLDNLPVFEKLFRRGKILLETVGTLSLHIFDNSLACRNYIKARYSYVFIDEYQDCGKEQHDLFLKIRNLGLIAIAVGDANQSIFKFSGKSAEFLLDLAASYSDFALYPLNYNHRCHPSIINYSLLLLNESAVTLQSDELRVYEKKVNGSEEEVGHWIGQMVPKFVAKFKTQQMNKVGILIRGRRTGQAISENLGLAHKFFEPTALDEDFTLWSDLFRQLLNLFFKEKSSRTEFLDNFLDTSSEKTKAMKILRSIEQIAAAIKQNTFDLNWIIAEMENIGYMLVPLGYSAKSINLLRDVLSNRGRLNSYKPAGTNEIQIMTLHKCKGLEFDIVFHLDLYQHIIPMFNGDRTQDLNLHYVGITRAKECCVLIHSTQRTRSSDNRIVNANPSDFLNSQVLAQSRNIFPIKKK
jgi:superfamily I DNA/RNA helicase